jgi:alcohol dehydrogenase (NADP+)
MTHAHIDGVKTIPAIGLGTWKLTRDEIRPTITTALNIGYRHFDCASIYNNEKEIGAALAAAFDCGKVKREDIWVSSKLWSNAHAAKHVRRALERTLKNLQLNYLDLYLIHWPVSFRADITFPKRADQFISLKELPIIETWMAMEKLLRKGLCRHIGVCNFSIPKLNELVNQATIQPYTNQIELHPYLQQPEMVTYCRDNSIKLTAYSPLGSGKTPVTLISKTTPSILTHPKIIHLATKHTATPAQILIAWGLGRKTVVIPKSTHPHHLKENYQAQQITLDTKDMDDLQQLDIKYRFLDGAHFTPPDSPYTMTTLWDE